MLDGSEYILVRATRAEAVDKVKAERGKGCEGLKSRFGGKSGNSVVAL